MKRYLFLLVFTFCFLSCRVRKSPLYKVTFATKIDKKTRQAVIYFLMKYYESKPPVEGLHEIFFIGSTHPPDSCNYNFIPSK